MADVATTGNAAAVASSPTDGKLASDEIETAVGEVLGAIKGKPLTDEELKNAAPTEAQLYFALSYAQLKETKPNVAAAMLKEVPALRKQLAASKDPNPLFSAVGGFLDKAVRDKMLKQNVANSVKSTALGKAQMDKDRTHLSTKPTKIAPPKASTAPTTDGTAATTPSKLTQIANKSSEGKRLSTAQVVQTTRNAHDARLTNGARTDKILSTYLNSPFTKAKPTKVETTSKTPESKPVEPKPADPKPPETPPEVGTPEDLNPTPAPKPEDNVTGPNDFVYKPKSDTDGNAMIYVPISDTRSIWRVVIMPINDDDNMIAEAKWDGTTKKDGRAVYSLPKPGAEYGDEFRIRFIYTDNSKLDKATVTGGEYYDSSMG